MRHRDTHPAARAAEMDRPVSRPQVLDGCLGCCCCDLRLSDPSDLAVVLRDYPCVHRLDLTSARVRDALVAELARSAVASDAAETVP